VSSDPSTRTTGDDGNDVPKPVLRRAVAASAIGNATEWFDYSIYANLVVQLTANFFPGEQPRR